MCLTTLIICVIILIVRRDTKMTISQVNKRVPKHVPAEARIDVSPTQRGYHIDFRDEATCWHHENYVSPENTLARAEYLLSRGWKLFVPDRLTWLRNQIMARR
jgi:hypothetical protein